MMLPLVCPPHMPPALAAAVSAMDAPPEEGGRPLSTDETWSAMLWAVELSDVAFLRALAEREPELANISAPISLMSIVCVRDAAPADRIAMLEIFRDYKVSADVYRAAPFRFANLLMSACAGGCADIVRWLIDQGYTGDAERHQEALKMAARVQNLECFRLIAALGARWGPETGGPLTEYSFENLCARDDGAFVQAMCAAGAIPTTRTIIFATEKDAAASALLAACPAAVAQAVSGIDTHPRTGSAEEIKAVRERDRAYWAAARARAEACIAPGSPGT